LNEFLYLLISGSETVKGKGGSALPYLPCKTSGTGKSERTCCE
jgi:hypothetical protein